MPDRSLGSLWRDPDWHSYPLDSATTFRRLAELGEPRGTPRQVAQQIRLESAQCRSAHRRRNLAGRNMGDSLHTCLPIRSEYRATSPYSLRRLWIRNPQRVSYEGLQVTHPLLVPLGPIASDLGPLLLFLLRGRPVVYELRGKLPLAGNLDGPIQSRKGRLDAVNLLPQADIGRQVDLGQERIVGRLSPSSTANTLSLSG